MADCIGTGFPQFSCAVVQMRYSRGGSGGKTVKERAQVGFAESNNTADNRANIGGTIIGAPIVGQ